MGWIKELWLATLAYWWVLMSCAVFTFLGLYAEVFKKDNHWIIRDSFIIAGLSVIVAIALAWRDEHRKLIAEMRKNAKPLFKAEIDCVVRNARGKGGFFVHVHVVNLTDVVTTLRKLFLHDQTTGEMLRPCGFGKVCVRREGVHHLAIDQTEEGISRSESSLFDQIPDALNGMKTTPFLRGVAQSGWLLFEKPYDVQESESPFLSLDVEDSFGTLHKGEVLNQQYEYGTF